MTWLDWVAVAMAVYFVAQGLFKGVTAAALGALAIVVAYVGAALALPAVGSRVEAATPLPAEWARLVGFVLTFLVLYTVLALLISILPGGKRPSLPAQVLGLFAGAAKATVAVLALVGILLASPLSDAFGQDVERSPIVRHVAGLQRQGVQALLRISPAKFPPVGPDHKF
jgi:uncharacterized membrane protein required for colicin V production